MHIITKNPPSGQDHHGQYYYQNISLNFAHFSGCPFKHCSPSLLRQRLTAYKTPKSAIDEIVELVKKHHYQIACQKYFAAKHAVSLFTKLSLIK